MGNNSKRFVINWTPYEPTPDHYRVYSAEGDTVTLDDPWVTSRQPQYDIATLNNLKSDTFSCTIGIVAVVGGVPLPDWHFIGGYILTEVYITDEKWDVWVIDTRLLQDPFDERFSDRVSFEDLKVLPGTPVPEVREACERWFGRFWPETDPEWEGTLIEPQFFYDETLRSERAIRENKEFMLYDRTLMNALQAQRDHISPEWYPKDE